MSDHVKLPRRGLLKFFAALVAFAHLPGAAKRDSEVVELNGWILRKDDLA